MGYGTASAGSHGKAYAWQYIKRSADGISGYQHRACINGYIGIPIRFAQRNRVLKTVWWVQDK